MQSTAPSAVRARHAAQARRFCGVIAALGVALGLTACSAPPPAEPAAPPALDTAASSDCGLARFEATATATLNAYRTVGARCGGPGRHRTAAPLTWQPALLPVAGTTVRERAATSTPDPEVATRTWRARLAAAGYGDADRLPVNRAQGPRTVEAALADWVSHDADCARLMQPEPTEFVLACAASATGQRHWLLLLAPAR